MLVERLIIGLFVLIMGLLFGFAGYRLFRVMMVIWGFLLGFFISLQVIGALLGNGLLATGLAWGAGIVAGLLLATLAYALYTAALTLLGASVGYILGTALMNGLGIGNQTMLVIIVGLILAIFFAVLILALDLARLLIIINTALGGAAAIVIGILLLTMPLPADFLHFDLFETLIESEPAWLLLWLGLTIGGCIFQLQNTRRYQLEKYVLARKVSSRNKLDTF